jgi:hypothetical protein
VIESCNNRVLRLLGITVRIDSNRFSGCRNPASASSRRGTVGTERRESYGGDYSTVNNAQRLSATLSIRPRGRVQIIDM